MKIKKKVVAAESEKVYIKYSLAPLSLEENLPSQLSETLYAWKECGNKWLTSLEASLEVGSKGLHTENQIEINCCRVLVFLGYMVDRRERGEASLVRYRLSKKGLKAIGASETLGLDQPVATAVVTVGSEEDCVVCDGTGVDGSDLCERCNGTGIEPDGVKAATKAKRSLPEKKAAPVKTATVIKTKVKRK